MKFVIQGYYAGQLAAESARGLREHLRSLHIVIDLYEHGPYITRHMKEGLGILHTYYTLSFKLPTPPGVLSLKALHISLSFTFISNVRRPGLANQKAPSAAAPLDHICPRAEVPKLMFVLGPRRLHGEEGNI